MKFCKKCGKTTAILNKTPHELCPECNAKATPQPSAADRSLSAQLGKCQLSITGSQIKLHSPEGWLLWNGETSKSYTLATIANHADKILSIREKQQKR